MIVATFQHICPINLDAMTKYSVPRYPKKLFVILPNKSNFQVVYYTSEHMMHRMTSIFEPLQFFLKEICKLIRLTVGLNP